MAYAVITVVWQLLWGYLNQSPNFSHGLWIAQYGFPYLCGIVALICSMAYLWRNVIGRWGNKPYQDRQGKEGGNVNIGVHKRQHKWKGVLKIVLSLAIVYSLVAVLIHIWTYGIMVIKQTNDIDTIILQNIIPDVICCCALIFCIVLLWQKESQVNIQICCLWLWID